MQLAAGHTEQKSADRPPQVQQHVENHENTEQLQYVYQWSYLQSWPPLATNANGQHQPTETLVEHIVFHHIFHLTHYIQ